MIEEANGNWRTGKLVKPFGRGVNFQIEVKDVNSVIKPLKKNRHALFRGLEDNWYEKGNKLLGCREFLVMDPDGYLLRFPQRTGSKKNTKNRI